MFVRWKKFQREYLALRGVRICQIQLESNCYESISLMFKFCPIFYSLTCAQKQTLVLCICVRTFPTRVQHSGMSLAASNGSVWLGDGDPRSRRG